MHKRHLLILALVLSLVATTASARPRQEDVQKTVVTDRAAKQMLLGRHMFSMQWVSWDYFGVATVTERDGVLYVEGEQRQRDGTDFVTIDGRITRVDKTEFTFEGTIVTQVSYINNGQPCTRDGEFTFAIKGGRKYWRLQQMQNPCDEATDYVDIYFRRQ